jgi:hypothetical protein
MNNERAAEILTRRHNHYVSDHESVVEAENMGAAALLAVSRLEAEREELVEAIAEYCRGCSAFDSSTTDPNELGSLTIRHGFRDLLVKHGRVTKNGERYEWRKQ